MCDVAAALMVASGVNQYVQGTMAANAQEGYQNKVFKLNKGLADQNAFQSYMALADRQIQEQKATAASLEDISQQSRRAQALTRVAAGEAGVGGASLDAVLSDFKRQELTNQYVSQQNLQFTEQQIARERDAVRARQQGQILAATPEPVQRPSLLGSLLNIGAGVTGHVYGSYFNQQEGTLDLSQSPFAKGKLF